MRIGIVTVGTLGDVAPYLALAQGFVAAGDEVKIVTFQQFEPLIRRFGFEFHAVNRNLEEFMKRDWTQFEVTIGTVMQTLRRMPETLHMAQLLLQDFMQDCLDAFTNVDLVLGQVVGHLAAWPIAQQLNIPYHAAYYSPLSRTRSFPNAFSTSVLPSKPGWYAWWGKGSYNWWTHTLSSYIFWLHMRPIVLKAQQAVLKRSLTSLDPKVPILYGHSPAILPKPPEWGPHITVTGFWLLQQQEDWQPPSDLLAFLNAGPSPIYIGFGSMAGHGAKKVIRLCVQALKALNMRGIILADGKEWSDLHDCDNLFFLQSAPHSWLFPRMAAIIHHGGPGTTATALQSGIPQMIVPFTSDQSFWGHLISVLCLGPTPLHHQKLQALQVQNAITKLMTDSDMRLRALALSELIRSENGVARAVETVHEFMQTKSLLQESHL